MTELRVTRLETSAVDAYLTVLNDAFLGQIPPAGLVRERAAFHARPGAHYGVFDGTELVGVAAAPTRPMTLPGGIVAQVSAVTSVAVSPSHRRRGVFATLVRHQLADLAEHGPVLSALWPSQGALYTRFGYAPATWQGPLVVRHGARLRPGVPIAEGRVRELPRQRAMAAIRELHDRIAPSHAGWLHRDDGHWTLLLEDPVGGAAPSDLRFALHDGGYLVYRVVPKVTPAGRRHELHIRDLAAVDTTVRAALWRHVLGLDLSGSVHFELSTPDEPVLHMLADPRAAEQAVRDGMWVRLADVPGALALRRYRTALSITFSVTDALLPGNAGLWRLVADESGKAVVERGSGEPDLALDVAELGAVYLGGTSLAALAAAGRVRARDPELLAVADAAFGHTPLPHCTIVF
ncbi:GNAT family N-acetyltransferase [Amycolatopsis sp. NPDC059021]|uniref:GNAT family N-acetyltransferase n=1 Tax=Amycolatopsis sp. NPDC059021 TaxID=3346704 RepID=UPI0036720A89